MLSPLGSYYDDADSPEPRKRHLKDTARFKRRLIIGIAMLAALPGIGSVFSPQVSLGDQTPLEFGQGSQTLSACDSSILVALGTSWYQTSSFFRLSTITLSDLNTTDSACFGKTIVLRMLESNGNELDLDPGGGTSLVYTVSGNKSATETRIISIDSGINVDSTLVARVTIETS